MACHAIHVSVFLLSCFVCGVGALRPWWSLWGTPLELHSQMELAKQSCLSSFSQKGGGHFPSFFTNLKKPRLFSHSWEQWAQNPPPEAFRFISFQPWAFRNPGTPVFGCSWKKCYFPDDLIFLRAHQMQWPWVCFLASAIEASKNRRIFWEMSVVRKKRPLASWTSI